jgi:hypothetical protein
MYGSNINLDEHGEVASVVDGSIALQGYLALCEAQGFGCPDVLLE